MGQKGDKHTNEAQLTTELTLEKLSAIEGISSKKMFGGYGIFHNGKMFGIVDPEGNVALKVNDALVSEYLRMGSSKHGKMPYYSVPDKVFKSGAFIELARRSIAIL